MTDQVGSSTSCDHLDSDSVGERHSLSTKFDPLLAASAGTDSPSSITQSIDLINSSTASASTSTNSYTTSNPTSNSPSYNHSTLSSINGIHLSKRQRSPNWTNKEDEQLARSWVEISKSPLVFSGEQRGEEFFRRVSDHFNLHWHGPPRTPAGVRERWGILQPACMRFNTIYHQILTNLQQTQPGTSLEQCRRLAHECFSEQAVTRTQRHRQFQYESVWEIVRETPKFQFPTSRKTSNPLNTASPSITLNSALINGQEQPRKEIDMLADSRPGTEPNGNPSSSSLQASPSCHVLGQIESKKRKTSAQQWLSQREESDAELAGSPHSLALGDRRNKQENGFQNASSFFHNDKLTLERERFLADQEGRRKESIRKDQELELKIKASERDDLILDLQIIRTPFTDCQDPTSKKALELLKAAVLKKHDNSRT